MLPATFPNAVLVEKVPHGVRSTVRSLCSAVGIECRVTGPASERVVYLRNTATIEVHREPGSVGDVSVGLPKKAEHERALLALGVLAYVVFDYAARESLRGRPEAAISMPLGRPRLARPLSSAERQRRWRAKKQDHLPEGAR